MLPLPTLLLSVRHKLYCSLGCPNSFFFTRRLEALLFFYDYKAVKMCYYYVKLELWDNAGHLYELTNGT